MEHKNSNLDDLVGKELEKYHPNNQRNNNNKYTSSGYMYVSISCMFTALGSTTDSPWMFVPALGFSLAGVIDSGYALYRRKKDKE